jgi:hypothetical protein
LEERTFGLDALSMLRQCFDEAWQAIGRNFSADEVDAARSKLASIIVDLTSNREVG